MCCFNVNLFITKRSRIEKKLMCCFNVNLFITKRSRIEKKLMCCFNVNLFITKRSLIEKKLMCCFNVNLFITKRSRIEKKLMCCFNVNLLITKRFYCFMKSFFYTIFHPVYLTTFEFTSFGFLYLIVSCCLVSRSVHEKKVFFVEIISKIFVWKTATSLFQFLGCKVFSFFNFNGDIKNGTPHFSFR